MASSRVEIALKQIEFARSYTMTLLEDLSEEEWYWQPEPAVTHIAWQLGHLAMAQYGLTLFRQRGRADIDTELMSGKFRKKFMKGTTPQGGAENYPTPTEIREVLDRVNAQMLEEVPTFSEESLDEPVDMPFAGFPTKYGSLLFCAHHEMLHAGQIGLVRRLMGKDPVR